jgi:hypothetical protein
MLSTFAAPPAAAPAARVTASRAARALSAAQRGRSDSRSVAAQARRLAAPLVGATQPQPVYSAPRRTLTWSHLCAQAVAAPPQAMASLYREPVIPANLHGFEVVRTEYISEYDASAVLYRHVQTGAEARSQPPSLARPCSLPCSPVQLMSLTCDDENKCFGVVLRTPPADSTGIPHILEHSVLCGSARYPVKEPFVELMKSSLNTFLNAFTYPDRTCYPVASTNTKDFYNLVDVYLDAVYHPKCVGDEATFAQEGWHHELDSPDGELTFKGVVFNEMKGVYSSPDSVLGREIQQALFPSNAYGVDSGGDPTVIPSLTFAQFRDFHSRYYHPSNSRLWFYGDDDPETRLRMLNAEQFDDARQILRDIDSLDSHTAFLFDKINFLMDATVGFINISQNKVIKIFSVASVALLPPTLVASIYGMNLPFPEFTLLGGYAYPYVVSVMFLSAALPMWFCYKRGWLR